MNAEDRKKNIKQLYQFSEGKDHHIKISIKTTNNKLQLSKIYRKKSNS